MRVLGACLLGALTCACGGAGTSSVQSALGGSELDRSIRVVNVGGTDATTARVLGAASAPGGDVVVVGTFREEIPFDPAHTRVAGGSFVARLAPDLAPRFAVVLDAPGFPRAVVADAGGALVLSSSPDSPEGPFLTRIDSTGRVTQRRDLGFGGVVAGAVADGAGGVLVRDQEDGTRLVHLDAAGAISWSALLAPPYVNDFPATLEENAILPSLALLRDGTVVAVHPGEPTSAAGPVQTLTRVSPSGAILGHAPVRMGRLPIVAAASDGTVAVSSRALGICEASALAIVRVDPVGNTLWTRCIPGQVSGLRLAVAADGTVAVAGQFTGVLDFGDAPHRTDGLASFVVWLDSSGKARRSVALGGAWSFVAAQALLTSASDLVLLGASGIGGPAGALRQTRLFAVRLSP
jgi:hypothetical protein